MSDAFDQILLSFLDVAEEEGIDLQEDCLEVNLTLDEAPGLIFSIIVESKESFEETYDGRNLH